MSCDPDLFVDSNLSQFFCRPIDQAYKRLITWLCTEGRLVVCQTLVAEYHDAVRGSDRATALVVIVDRLQRDGRLRFFKKGEMQAFRIKANRRKRLRSNRRDHDYLKIVLLSDRKIGLSDDKDLRYDINNYPGYAAVAAGHPSEVDYRSTV